MHLAEFNFGTLRYAWEDPRLAGFADNVDRVNAIAQRSPGFVWMLDEDRMDYEQNAPEGALAHRPGSASTLSVWQTPKQLWAFVDKTLHAKFMARYDEWFVPGDRGHLVCWWIDAGHRPTVAEGLERWQELQDNGPTTDIFGGPELRRLAERRDDAVG